MAETKPISATEFLTLARRRWSQRRATPIEEYRGVVFRRLVRDLEKKSEG